MVSILEFSLDIYLQDKEKYGIVSIQLLSFVISELNKASGKSQAPAVFFFTEENASDNGKVIRWING